MANYFLKLAWKNLWRNRRRTLLTVNAIGIGVMALVFLHNFYDTFHDQLIHNVIRYHSGHLVLAAKDYHSRLSPNLFMRDGAPAIDWAKSRPEIADWSGRVRLQGLLSAAEGSSNVLFVGVDPEREKRLTQFARDTIEGSFDEPAGGSGHTMVIGQGLAEILKVGVGSKVVALTQGVDGSIGNELFRVRGIFKTHSDMDKAVVFVSLPAARILAALPDGAFHQIAIALREESSLAAVRASARQAFSQLEALGWQEVQKPVMAIIDLNKGVNRLLMLIILSVAAMGIANSILMSLLERTREFGVMMAIGTTKREVAGIVIGETFLLCLVGVLIGNVLGMATTEVFHHFGFDLRWLTQNSYTVEGMIVQTISYPTIRLGNSLIVTAMILAVSLLVSVFPARYIARLSAVQALKAT